MESCFKPTGLLVRNFIQGSKPFMIIQADGSNLYYNRNELRELGEPYDSAATKVATQIIPVLVVPQN